MVLVGGDATIPFFRYPDQNALGPESDYIPPVAADVAVGGQPPLGLRPRPGRVRLEREHLARHLQLPDPGPRRRPARRDGGGSVRDARRLYGDARTASSPTPTTSLVTGYDFFRDDADKIKGYLDAGIGHDGRCPARRRTTSAHRPPDAWTGAQMKTAVTGSRHDLIFMGGHFSANEALAADFATTMSSTDVTASAANFQNSIVFSAGCHSGYNLLDADQVNGVTQPRRLGPGLCSQEGDAGRRHRLPVRRRRADPIQRADLRRVRPPAARPNHARRQWSGCARVGTDQGEADLPRVDAGHPRPAREVHPRGDAVRAADAERQHAGGP